jgi:hypothetical protein
VIIDESIAYGEPECISSDSELLLFFNSGELKQLTFAPASVFYSVN